MPKAEGKASLAEQIARKAHEGQTRYDGTPYIEHPKAVASMLGTNQEYYEVQAAWLHDVLEDTKVTAEDLRQNHVDHIVITAVEALTKRDGEPYENYLRRVKENPYAVRVKVADMLHNLSDTPTKNQVKRYARGLAYLLGMHLIEAGEDGGK